MIYIYMCMHVCTILYILYKVKVGVSNLLTGVNADGGISASSVTQNLQMWVTADMVLSVSALRGT